MSRKVQKSQEELQQEVNELKARLGADFRIQIAEKTKKVSVYGLGQRFPVTLSKSGWQTLLEHAEEIEEFIEENKKHIL